MSADENNDVADEEHADEQAAAQAEEAVVKRDHEAADGKKSKDQIDEDPMSLPPHGTEVFISRLPRDVTEAQVRVFCEKAGEVHSLRVPRDPEGMNKGYGFCVYKTREMAAAAIETLQLTEIAESPGRKVNLVASTVKHKLFLGNLLKEMSREELKSTLELEVKGVESVDLMADKENPAINRGFGFVSFYNHTAAELARRFLGTPDYRMKGRTLTVMWADPKRNEVVDQEKVKSVYVGNLPESYDEAKLRAVFEVYGKVTEVTILHTPDDPNKLRNYSFLHFVERSSALKAVEEASERKVAMEGRDLTVHMAKPHTNPRADEAGGTGSGRDPNGNPRFDDRYGGRGGGRGGAQDRYAGQSRMPAGAPRSERGLATPMPRGYGRPRHDEYASEYDGYDGGYDPYGGTNAGYTGAYTGYPTSMTMVPMMMPGGQVGYVMASTAAANIHYARGSVAAAPPPRRAPPREAPEAYRAPEAYESWERQPQAGRGPGGRGGPPPPPPPPQHRRSEHPEYAAEGGRPRGGPPPRDPPPVAAAPPSARSAAPAAGRASAAAAAAPASRYGPPSNRGGATGYGRGSGGGSRYQPY
ncbi:MAG: hypothetical protein WDW36_006260 [Sanguina aurantia]